MYARQVRVPPSLAWKTKGIIVIVETESPIASHQKTITNSAEEKITTGMSEKKEIRNLEELRSLRLADEGYIVITNGAHQATIHRVNAPCISTTNFRLGQHQRAQAGGLLLGR
jgi:hypothetical protein